MNADKAVCAAVRSGPSPGSAMWFVLPAAGQSARLRWAQRAVTTLPAVPPQASAQVPLRRVRPRVSSRRRFRAAMRVCSHQSPLAVPR